MNLHDIPAQMGQAASNVLAGRPATGPGAIALAMLVALVVCLLFRLTRRPDRRSARRGGRS